MPPFLTGSPVRMVSTDYYAGEADDNITMDMHYTLSVLRRTRNSVQKISIMCDHWNLLFFDILSQHAPNTVYIEYKFIEDEGDGVLDVKLVG
jgi:hypothetical protein